MADVHKLKQWDQVHASEAYEAKKNKEKQCNIAS